MQGEADLFEIIGAGRAGGGFAHFLNRGQQKSYENCNYGNDNQ
jgi:hypothetical protein